MTRKSALWATLKTLQVPTIRYQTATILQLENAIVMAKPALPYLESVSSIQGINGDRFPRNSNILSKYTSIGYTLKGDELIAPKTSETFEFSYVNEMYDEIAQFDNVKYIVLDFLEGNPAIVPYDLSFSKRIKEILDRISGEVLFTYTVVFGGSGSHGPAFDSTKLNCAIDACIRHCNLNHYKIPSIPDEYRFGVFESDFQSIVNLFQFPIKLDCDGEIQIYKPKTKMNKILCLQMHSNHVALTLTKKKTMYIDLIGSSILDYIRDNIPLNSITNLIESSEICLIQTTARDFQVRFQDGIDLQEVDCVTSGQYYYKRHFDYYSTLPIPISSKHPNIEAIKACRTMTINYSTNFKVDNAEIIDINSAYNHFGVLPTDLSYFYDCSTWIQSDVISTILKREGFALISKLQIGDITLSSWQPFNVLRMLITRYQFSKIQCSQMMLSNGTTTFDIDGFMNLNVQKIDDLNVGYDKRRWHKCLGKHMMIESVKSKCTTDPVEARSSGGIQHQLLKGLYVCSNVKPHIGRNFYPHITGYVHGYTNMKMINEYLNLRRQGFTVLRMWVDGIYFQKNVGSVYKTNDDWKYEDTSKKITREFVECVSIREPVELVQMSSIYIEPSISDLIVYQGIPGAGKSFMMEQIYKASPEISLIVVPTNQLKRKYLPVDPNTSTHQKITASRKLNYDWVRIILLDEYTMVSQADFNRLKLRFINLQKIYLFGDSYQLRNITGRALDISDGTLIELTENYRVLDPVFQAQLLKFRIDHKYEFITNRLSIEEAIKSKSLILSATNEQITRINKIGLEMNPNPTIHGYAKDCPIIFNKDIKRFDILRNDEGIIEAIDDGQLHIRVNGEIEIFEIEDAKAIVDGVRSIELSYSMTYHKCQGKTITSNVVINTKDMHKFKPDIRKRMIYVGVTRVRAVNQLAILI